MLINPANILLPNDKIDMTKWAVVACDQFTSQPSYWQQVDELTQGVCSTRHLILPELLLPKVNDAMISSINRQMQDYLNNDVFVEHKDCFVLLERKTMCQSKRVGIVLSVDLEQYSFNHADKAKIRATEGTVVERIPPRLVIRRDAPLELPHIMLLYDDKDNVVLNNIYKNMDKLLKLYDFELNMQGGHATGYKIEDTDSVIRDFYSLYNADVADDMLFAVGDGNHSLATAKTLWEEIKPTLSAAEQESHPARFALVEAVNIYDEGIVFEPIHRVIFNASELLVSQLTALSGEVKTQILNPQGNCCDLHLPKNTAIAVKLVQNILDAYIADNPSTSIDYVHGEQNVKEVLSQNENSIGVLMPTFPKDQLFEFVKQNGSLPRKTFSMGEAEEKRYYIESKKIR